MHDSYLGKAGQLLMQRLQHLKARHRHGTRNQQAGSMHTLSHCPAPTSCESQHIRTDKRGQPQARMVQQWLPVCAASYMAAAADAGLLCNSSVPLALTVSGDSHSDTRLSHSATDTVTVCKLHCNRHTWLQGGLLRQQR